MNVYFCKLTKGDKPVYLCVASVMGIEFCEAITKVLDNSWDRDDVVVLREDWSDTLKRQFVQDPDYDDVFPLRYNPEIEVLI